MVNTDYQSLLGQKKQDLAVLNSRIDANTKRIAELVATLGIDATDLNAALLAKKAELEAQQEGLESELADLLSKLPQEAQ